MGSLQPGRQLVFLLSSLPTGALWVVRSLPAACSFRSRPGGSVTSAPAGIWMRQTAIRGPGTRGQTCHHCVGWASTDQGFHFSIPHSGQCETTRFCDLAPNRPCGLPGTGLFPLRTSPYGPHLGPRAGHRQVRWNGDKSVQVENCIF